MGLIILRMAMGYWYYALLGWFPIQAGDGFYRIMEAWAWAKKPFFHAGSLMALPLHTWVLGVLLRFFPGGVVVVPALLNTACSVAALLLIYKITLALFDDPPTALVAAAITLFQPAMLQTGTQGGDRGAMLQFFVLAGCCFWIQFMRQRRLRHQYLAAASFSLASAVRYEGWFFLAAFTGLHLHELYRSMGRIRRRPWRPIGANLAATLFISWWFVLAWLAYNWRTFHDPLMFLRDNAQDPIFSNTWVNLLAYFDLQFVLYAPIFALAILGFGEDEVAVKYLFFPLGFIAGFLLVTVSGGSNPFNNHTWPPILLLIPFAARALRRCFGAGTRQFVLVLFLFFPVASRSLLYCVDQTDLLHEFVATLMSNGQLPEDNLMAQWLRRLWLSGAMKETDLALIEIPDAAWHQDMRIWSALSVKLVSPDHVVFDRRSQYPGGAGRRHLNKAGNPSLLDLKPGALLDCLRKAHIRAVLVHRPASVRKLRALMPRFAVLGNSHLFFDPTRGRIAAKTRKASAARAGGGRLPLVR